MHRWTTTTNGRAKIEITGRTIRIWWVDTKCLATCLSKKKFSEILISEVCTKWEKQRERETFEQMKSVQKLIGNHETIQQLTSQLHQMKEHMNSMNDSGDCQDVESNFCGTLSHVSSQPSMIPSSRSLLSRDKRLPLDTESIWSTRKRFWKSMFYAWFTQRSSSKEFNLTTCKETEKCKGNEPCTSYSRTFTIHNYGYGTAYTFTHNNITLEHTAMNDKNTITHPDAYNTQFWARCAPSVDAQCLT